MDIETLIDLAYRIDLFKLRQIYCMEQTDNIGSLYNQWNAVKITLIPLTSSQIRDIQRQIPYYGYINQELHTIIEHRRTQEAYERYQRG